MRATFDAVVKAAVVRKQTQLAELGQCHGASHHALTRLQNTSSNTSHQPTFFKVVSSNGRNDFGVNLLFGSFVQRTPQGLVVHHNAVVNHAHPIAEHRLVVG